MPYAPGLADAFARELGLDGRGRLIDIGCGPGIVALELAALFEEVVGVDADPDMIAEAAREARRRGVENGQWLAMRAEELPGELGTFRVATLAQSFHWMDREPVAQAIQGMLEPGGALVHVNAFTRSGIEASSSPYPNLRGRRSRPSFVDTSGPRPWRGRVVVTRCSSISMASSDDPSAVPTW